jgi:hypothetical protein
MCDIDSCIGKEGQDNGRGEQIENSFDVPRELLGSVGGGTSSSLREWPPSWAKVLSFMLASFLRSDGSISHEGYDKEDKKKDWIRGAQVLEQLKGCMGIHCPLNIPEMSVSNKVHDKVLPRTKGKEREAGFGSERTGRVWRKIDARNGGTQEGFGETIGFPRGNFNVFRSKLKMKKQKQT